MAAKKTGAKRSLARRSRKSSARESKKNNISLAILSAIIIIGVLFVVVSIDSSDSFGKPGIAVIPIKGEITLFGNNGGILGGGSLSAVDIANLVEKADNDPSIKAIILEINSPGGTVIASKEITEAVKQTDKPTVAWLREVAASGGYWVASGTDIIVADPASITGSIGVTSSYLQFSDLFEKQGVTYERLVTGDFKDVGSPFTELSPAGRQLLQAKIDAINQMFISEIATNRNMETSYVATLATGEIFLGIEAHELGLVDVLGGEQAAKIAAESLANVEGTKLIRMEKKQSLLEGFTLKADNAFYSLGLGIGSAWNPMNQDTDLALRAEL